MEFDGDDETVAAHAESVGALKCFSHSRRSLPVQVVGLGDASVSNKFALFAKALMQETSPSDENARRESASGWLADQGTELILECYYYYYYY